MAEEPNYSGEVERTFITQEGERVSKVRTTFGGVLYTSEEEGQLSQQEYSAKSAQRKEVRQFQEKESEDIDVSDLSDRYQADQTRPIGDLEPGTVAREEAKQQNMFVGFMADNDTPNDRVEAVRAYENMLSELRQADSEGEMRDIKDDYNIGGS